MHKIVPAGSYDDGPLAAMIKVSSRGLIGNDRRGFIKRAGHAMLDAIDHATPGEELIHLLAMGSTEIIGPNRNGDGFRAAELVKRAHTFEKHAFWFRNHKNKDTDLRYGRPYKAAYYSPMGRVEMIVGLCRTKEAADRYGELGRVADEELDDLASGRDLAVSMACMLPFDVCSGCGHCARKTADYCTAAMCKRGGLRDNITMVCADGHILHADNPDVTFFDISRVRRPADRIGYVTGLLKSAADWGGCGAEQAEALGLVTPGRVFVPGMGSPRAKAAAYAAIKLADAEVEARSDSLALAVHPMFCDVSVPASASTRRLMLGLARDKVAMPLVDWLVASGAGREDSVAAARDISARLPGAFCRLVVADDFHEKLGEAADGFADSPLFVPESAALRGEYGLDRGAAMRRVGVATLRELEPPRLLPLAGAADDGDAAEALALKYAAYSAAVVGEISPDDPDFSLACALLARRNRVASI